MCLQNKKYKEQSVIIFIIILDSVCSEIFFFALIQNKYYDQTIKKKEKKGTLKEELNNNLSQLMQLNQEANFVNKRNDRKDNNRRTGINDANFFLIYTTKVRNKL